MATSRIGISNSGFNPKSIAGKTSTTTKIGIVLDVILDDTHDLLIKFNVTDVEQKNTSNIGFAAIRQLGDSTSEFNNNKVYPPFNPEEGIPLVGEMVQLIDVTGRLHYKRTITGNINVGNARTDIDIITYPTTQKDDDNGASELSTANTTGTPSGGSGTDDRKTEIGKYFKEQQVNPLKLYEGDKIIQSRFGQSIRFSGYNNGEGEERKFAPTIILRNRQSSESLSKLKKGSITEEDVNKDGTTIAITSGDYKLNFQPGIIDDGGSSNFETKPTHFESYPSELKGSDQLLVNSERIIISAKSKEMIFYSKGNYGFISDGKMSIDNGKAGADLDFNGDVRITTNDNNTYILGGKGQIYLNTESDAEPLVRGQTLQGLLEELIDAINAQIFKTPSGPTATGPENRGTFNDIKGRLEKFKSTLNFTE
jgi:hypothetical protein